MSPLYSMSHTVKFFLCWESITAVIDRGAILSYWASHVVQQVTYFLGAVHLLQINYSIISGVVHVIKSSVNIHINPDPDWLLCPMSLLEVKKTKKCCLLCDSVTTKLSSILQLYLGLQQRAYMLTVSLQKTSPHQQL